MSAQSDKISDLKLKLQSATKRRLRNERVENSLRHLERSLSEDVSLLKSECEFLLLQVQDLKNVIPVVAHQKIMAEICSVSEKTKNENCLSNINTHKQGFETIFAEERKKSEIHNKELKEKVAEQEEIERQKIAKILEMNELKGKEAAGIERECDAIERDCTVLRNRNKAIMLKLRRKLVKAEDTRRELMKKNGLVLK